MPPTVLVTGANAGIGRATALAVARTGARVVLLCRNPRKGKLALQELREASSNADLHLVLADLGDFDAVRAAAEQVLTRFDRLDVLVNNAGHTFPRRELTASGVEATLAVNVLGPFLLTELLIPRLRESEPARIVNLAGMYYARGELELDDLEYARRPYSSMAAACQAQLARVLLTVEWPSWLLM